MEPLEEVSRKKRNNAWKAYQELNQDLKFTSHKEGVKEGVIQGKKVVQKSPKYDKTGQIFKSYIKSKSL